MMPICRICGGTLNNEIFHISNMPLTDDFIEISRQEEREYVRDIHIYRCDNCGVVQNPDDFDHEGYYQNYQYSAGHSDFTQRFMNAYANEISAAFWKVNGRAPASVIEIGSGDGQQLMCFRSLGIKLLKGVEPSEYLAKIANEIGIDTDTALFGTNIVSRLPSPIDACLSSYTFDHVRQPMDYLAAAHNLLIWGGILALEIHDFTKIVDRTEYCLFEHEHTIYLSSEDVRNLLERSGFSIIAINPLPSDKTRGNSLIIVARKKGIPGHDFRDPDASRKVKLISLKERIKFTIDRIDSWIKELPETSVLVGFGAGGRGVMTIAALTEHKKITALLDSNFRSNQFLTPKTRIPISGPDSWHQYKDAFCIVFSFGYYQEILDSLIRVGFKKEKIISLLDFYPNRDES